MDLVEFKIHCCKDCYDKLKMDLCEHMDLVTHFVGTDLAACPHYFHIYFTKQLQEDDSSDENGLL